MFELVSAKLEAQYKTVSQAKLMCVCLQQMLVETCDFVTTFRKSANFGCVYFSVR